MQIKTIVSCIAITFAAVHLNAQQHAVVAKKDSAVTVTNKSAVAVPATTVSNDPKKGYSHVPLAGEKSYFGEKNDFMNDFVRKYLELHYNSLSIVQGRSASPFSIIDDELKRRNMPKELKYLAVIESALNNNAVSRVGAVGPWQFMIPTAKSMGLTVTRKTDERRDLGKSTVAAAKYLEYLYGQLNDWLLVIAAYNSGPTPVVKAIQRTGSRNFWDIKEYLPRETQGHVLAFIATASIFENMSKFISLGSLPVDFKFGKDDENAGVKGAPGIAAAPVKKSPYTDEELKNMCIVRITDPLQMDYLAQEIGTDKRILTRWNYDYDMFVYKTYPTPFYNLRIPKDKMEVFLKKKNDITKRSKDIFAANK